MVIPKADQAERPQSQSKSVRILLGWVLFLCLLHWHHSVMAIEGEETVSCSRMQSTGQVWSGLCVQLLLSDQVAVWEAAHQKSRELFWSMLNLETIDNKSVCTTTRVCACLSFINCESLQCCLSRTKIKLKACVNEQHKKHISVIYEERVGFCTLRLLKSSLYSYQHEKFF